MRKGINPNKDNVLAPKIGGVVAVVITHLPGLYGYHSERLEVVKTSLRTLVENANEKFDNLVIWDNGSCDELISVLDFISPDVLVLSKNIGKTNALKSVLGFLEEDSIIAYADDDVEYYPNWLEPQLEILETFPNVGTVTGCPTKMQSTWATYSTTKWAISNAKVEEGKFIKDEWEKDYCESVGLDWPYHRTNTADIRNFKISYNSVEALALSHHFQFVGYSRIVNKFVSKSEFLMPAEQEFDENIDKAGFLRLSTTERYTRHIGNIL